VSGRHHSRWVVAAGALVVALGAVAWWSQGTESRAQTAEPVTGPSVRPKTGTSAKPVKAAWEPGAPRKVSIPALGVAAPVIPVKAPGRTLVPPSDPQRLGWWADGARPGAREGSALITGHTVHTGGGALDDLEDLRRGDTVVVRTDHGAIRYGVDRVRVYSKGSLADHANRVFSQDVAGRLVLITCEDWDGVRYLSNVVVTATPRG
jgi:LPXTG-site transpeptidase (sortase) family protein